MRNDFEYSITFEQFTLGTVASEQELELLSQFLPALLRDVIWQTSEEED